MATNDSDSTPDTVEAYIARQARTVQPILKKMRATIRTAAPDATEKIAWHMPTYWQGKDLINFAAFAHHVSIFPGAEAITAFSDRLTGYTTGKGTVQFQLDEPIPYVLIADIVRWKVASDSSSPDGLDYLDQKRVECLHDHHNEHPRCESPVISACG